MRQMHEFLLWLFYVSTCVRSKVCLRFVLHSLFVSFFFFFALLDITTFEAIFT